MDRTDQFSKKLAFKMFKTQLVEFKEYIELEKKIFSFYQQRSFCQFFKALPMFAAQSKLQKRKATKAKVFQETVLMKNFFTYLYSILQGRRDQEKYTEIFYYTKLGKKAFFSLKFWNGFNKVPGFQNIGTCVWILYNFLSYSLNKRRTSTTNTARGSHSVRYSVDYSAKGKTPDISFTERINGSREEFIFSLPAYFPLSMNKKYEAKYYEANKTLNLYVQQNLFQFWKKSTNTIKAFKTRNLNKFISTYFSVWKKFSVSKIIAKYNLKKHSAKWNRPVCVKLFKAWKSISREKKKLKNALNYVLTRKNMITMGQQFRHWYRLFRNSTKDRDFVRIADEQYMMKYLKKSWKAWTLFTEKSKRRSVIQHQFLRKKLELLQFYSLKAWKLFLRIKAEKQVKEAMKDRFFDKHASKRYFIAWKKFTSYKKNSEEMLSLIKLKKGKILMAKIFRRWKKVQLESLAENKLYKKLQQHYDSNMERK